tara:strand:+ start:143 stop:763 length:621 start_codon:yes stop_codon:yes gene_type:complete
MKYYINYLFIALFALAVNTEDVEYRLGFDYRIVENPLPVKKDGVVEIVETFWYGCAACYNFDAPVNSWAAKLNDDVKFSKAPVAWASVHELHATLYYTIEALNLDPSVHSAVFVSMHKEGNFLSSEKSIKDFLEGFGIAPEVTDKYLNSFTVKQRVSRAKKNARQLKVNSTPVMIVDGKYIIESRGSYQRILDVVDYVIELQRPNS